MSWWNWKKRRSEQRSTWTTSQSATDFDTVFGSGTTLTTASSMTVTPATALQVPAVFACLQVLSQDVGRTPVKFRQRVAPDTYQDATDHDLWDILGTLSNPEMTAYEFKHKMMWNLLTYGRAYAEIVRVNGRVTALWPLDPCAMRVDRTEQRTKRWTYSHAKGTTTWLFNASMPPILELTHETPLSRCRELIGTALALQVYTAKFFANGGRPIGVLQATGQISQTTVDRLRTFWTTTFEKPENAHKVAILEGGLEFKPISAPNTDSQLAEMWLAMNTSIAGVFRVPTFKIGDLTRATYSNMAAGELAYVTSTLDPLFQCWEEAIRRDLLTSRQYGMFSAQFDRNALIRNDVQAQHQSLATGIQAGFYSQNDARRTLGLNPIPNGDDYRINSALVQVSTDSEGFHAA